MFKAAPFDERWGTAADVARLPSADRTAAEALVATMAGWDEADLVAYRSAVLEELSSRRSGTVGGFLAVELAALQAIGDLEG